MPNITFNKAELDWLQSMLFGFGEEKWPGSVQSDESVFDDGVIQMSQLEHNWFKNLLAQVRDCIIHPDHVVSFDTRPIGQVPAAGLGKQQHDFISKILIDYKNGTAGNYIFRGPFGTNYKEGGQFPSMQGSANQNFEGQGAFPDNAFQSEANIFNDILIKIGDVVFDESNPTPRQTGGG